MTRKLHVRLVLVIVSIATIPLLILATIAGLWSARELEHQSLVLQSEVARRIERDIAGFISNRINELRVLERTNTLVSLDEDQIGAILGRLLAHDQVYQAVRLLDRDGETLVFASRSRAAPEDPGKWRDAPITRQDYWQREAFFVSPVRYDAPLREALIDIALPVLERRTGAVDRVILASVRFRPVQELLANAPPERTEAFVIDDAGMIVSHSQPAMVLSERIVTLPDRPGRYSLLDGAKGLVVWQPLSLVGGASRVVVTRPLAAALEDVYSALKITFLVGGVLLIAATWTGLRQARRIVAPVEALAQSARRISNGDLRSTVAPEGPEEIRALGQALEDMRRRLRDTVAELEQSEYAERQRALVTLQSIGDAVITTDRQGDIVYVNPVAEEVTGWTNEEAQGRPLPDVFHILDRSSRAVAPNPVERCLAMNGVIELANNTILVRKDGSERLISDSAAPIRQRDGQVVGVVMAFRDVTERKALEEALMHSQKMEALGQLTGGIAHDFNNLLQVIQGNAELLAEECGCDPELTVPILKAAGRGSELTSRLLSFGRRQALMPKTVVLRDFMDEMLPMVERTLGESYRISIRAGAGLWPVLVDPGQLEAALLNLLLNARDAMPNGGCMTISAVKAMAEDFRQEHVGALEERDFVAISVSDTGAGMSEETLQKAVDPFFTTKVVGQGSGLGLSMVYGFVMQSGGHFEIESAPGKGTTAIMFLPRSRERPALKEIASAEFQRAESSRTILVIEDDPDVRKLAMRTVRGLGYRALDAVDIATARSVMQKERTIDLVLSDVVLPGGVSGIDFAVELRRTHPDLPVVFVSGYPRDELELGDLSRTHVVLLSKPFRRADLAATLSAALSSLAETEPQV